MFKDSADFHASGPIFGPNKTVCLVRNLRKATPLWKFPGGKKEKVPIRPFGGLRDEAPIETFIREVFEETHLTIKKRHTKLVTSLPAQNPDGMPYNKHYFFSRIYSWRKLHNESREYEEARVFELDELDWLSDFHPAYRSVYIEHFKPLVATF